MLDDVVESYYLETGDGLFFAVKGLAHPPDRMIAVLRYAPDPNGERRRCGVSYRRYYDFAEQERLLRSLYPQYLAYDPVFQATLQSVPKALIRRIYNPRQGLQKLIQGAAAMGVADDACTFARLLQKEAGVSWAAIGISGSLLIDLHTEKSDLDFSVFGTENCRKVYDSTKVLLDSQSDPDLRRFDREGIEELYRQRSADTPMRFDDFASLEKNKVCQGNFRRRPYFIRFIKEPREAGETYGDLRYTPLGQATLAATIADDCESIFTPCRYGVSDVRILEGPHFEVNEILSFRGRFCEQARSGQPVLATGTLERVESRRGEVHHRLLLGNTAHDAMVHDRSRAMETK